MAFSFLKNINAPQKLNFSHTLLDKLINFEGSEDFTSKIDNNREKIIEIVKELVKQENRFRISRLEYEKKEKRYLENTIDSESKLDMTYWQENLQFKEIPREDILNSLKNEEINNLIVQLKQAVEIIKYAVLVCKRRTDYLFEQWEDISIDLINKIRGFEFKGLKKASNNLRIRLLPELAEMKSNLKQNLVEGSVSRIEILEKLDEYVLRVKQDIFGELTDSQIFMLENLNKELTSQELISFINDEDQRSDLTYLLESGKIEIVLINSINDLM